MNPPDSTTRDPDSDDLATMCASQLRCEEALLAAALPIARGIHAAFTALGLDAFAAALSGHQEFAKLIYEIHARRQSFRGRLGRQLALAAQEVTLTRALAHVRADARAALIAHAARVRRLADELATLNYQVSVHLRVYLEAYRRILRDLTNTSVSSGRYGPAGTAESHEYRPLVQIHG